MSEDKAPPGGMRHGLWFEGAAFDETGRRIKAYGTGGIGRAHCRCGVVSPVLKSGNARKAWHREHKRKMMGGE